MPSRYGRLHTLHLVVARIEHKESHACFGRYLLNQARSHLSVIDLCWRDCQSEGEFTFRIHGQVELVTEPGDLVAKGVEFRSPVRIAGLLALFLWLLLFVSMDSGAIDCDVAAVVFFVR